MVRTRQTTEDKSRAPGPLPERRGGRIKGRLSGEEREVVRGRAGPPGADDDEEEREEAEADEEEALILL